jgi:Replication-relaxation
MPYAKGSIQLNEARDLPLLRQILRSEFATHSQLFEFMRLEYCEQTRKAFDWRLRRLVDNGLVERQAPRAGMREVVYCVARSGAELLLDRGENCLFGRDRSHERHAERSVLHALRLNDIHLSALRAGVLLSWIGALEVRSRNELTEFGFAKDYDAILTVQTEAGDHHFALEYERSAKTIDRYRAIAEALGREVQVNHVLYLVTSDDLLRFVRSHVGKAQGRVCFGLSKDWHSQLLDMPVTSFLSTAPRRLQEFLDSAHPQPGCNHLLKAHLP